MPASDRPASGCKVVSAEGGSGDNLLDSRTPACCASYSAVDVDLRESSYRDVFCNVTDASSFDCPQTNSTFSIGSPRCRNLGTTSFVWNCGVMYYGSTRYCCRVEFTRWSLVLPIADPNSIQNRPEDSACWLARRARRFDLFVRSFVSWTR